MARRTVSVDEVVARHLSDEEGNPLHLRQNYYLAFRKSKMPLHNPQGFMNETYAQLTSVEIRDALESYTEPQLTFCTYRGDLASMTEVKSTFSHRRTHSSIT
jgi:hypothetical protein